MKKFKFYAVVFIVLVLSVSSLSKIEFTGHHPSKKDSSMIMRGHNLRYIKLITVSVNHPEPDIYEGISDWNDLKTEIDNKLDEADLPVFRAEPSIMGHEPRMSRLKVNVGYFKPADSEKYFCRIQLILSRLVRLGTNRNPERFYADVWQSDSVIAMAGEPNEIPKKAAEAALKLTEQFIADYKKANANYMPPKDTNPEVKPPDRKVPWYPKKPTPLKEEIKTEVSEGLIVSSKNSKVFHRAGCSAAKRIKAENITSFKTAGDAIRAGLRPCKICGKK